MKIYFAASIRGGRDNASIYPNIVSILEELGHEILSGIFANKNLDNNEGTDPDKGSEFIYNRDVDWIKEADAVVAEVTQPSLGVGYEIAKAESLNKKIVCLFKKQGDKNLSAMIDGSPNLDVIYYDNVEELKSRLEEIFR